MLAVDTDFKFPTERKHQALLQRKHQVILRICTLLSDVYQCLGPLPDVDGKEDTYSEVSLA